jgi:hypothetical protein
LRSLVLALAFTAMAGVAVAGKPGARVVLVDPDPELRRAVTTALAPWKLEVVTDPNPQIDTASASARADSLNARFVVWREGNELVVFDRERNETVRREGKPGTLEPVDAAAAALTVKTLMRLPPPEEDPAPPPVVTGSEIRVQAALETRIAKGSDTAIGGRFVGGVFAKPWGPELRFGAIADVGTAESVERAGFKGRWRDWAVLAAVSYALPRDGVEIEPYLGIGVGRSSFDGDDKGEDMDDIHDDRFLAVVRVGTWVRWRRGMWTIGGTLSLDAVRGTPTYTKVNNGSVIYEVPSSSVSLGFVVAADLGR